jgi:carboxyl-terminal processing protease
MVRGPKDSTVNLTVIHLGKKIQENIIVKRGTITLPSTSQAITQKVEQAIQRVVDKVKTVVIKDIPKQINPDNSANIIASNNKEENKTPILEQKDFYIFGFTNFSKTSADAFIDELKKFKKSGIKNLILDLRNNPGGYIDIAVEISNYFLKEGDIILKERVGANLEEIVYKSKGYKFFDNPEEIKVYILVNGNTASAAEILAAALHDNGKATIIGEKTFGKGSVQQLLDITEDMSLKVTIARWYTPKDISISGNGIIPDIIVGANKDNPNEDTTFEKAIEIVLENKNKK